MDASVSVTTLWQRCADFTVRVVPILWQWPRQIGKHIQLPKYNHQVCIVNTNNVGLKLISFSNFLYVYNYTCIFIFNKWYHLKWRIKNISKVLYTLWILCLPIFLFKEFCTQAIFYMWEYSVISFEFVVTQLSWYLMVVLPHGFITITKTNFERVSFS